jgi:mitofilin
VDLVLYSGLHSFSFVILTSPSLIPSYPIIVWSFVLLTTETLPGKKATHLFVGFVYNIYSTVHKSIMLRRVTSKAYYCHPLRRPSSAAATASAAVDVPRRTYAAATSREKRALKEEQIAGTSPPKTGAPAAAPSASGGGGGTMMAVLAAAVGGGGALAYYNGLIPGLEKPDEKTTAKEDKAKAGDSVVAKVADNKATEETVVGEKITEKPAETEPIVVDNEQPGPAEETEVVDEGEPAPEPVPADKEDAVPLVVVAAVEETPSKSPSPTLTETKIIEELEKVKALLTRESDKALSEAHAELAKLSSLNMNDIDEMTNTQLKVRLVQLAKEMEDRTKWEAVRLQQFLVMKEREVEDK